MMPDRFLPALLAVAALLGESCGPPPDQARHGIEVVVTFHALSTIVAPLLGPEGTVHVLLPTGASPHAFEPRPSDLRELSRAQLVLRAGAGVDGWVSDLVPVPSVALLDLVPDSASHASMVGVDPHVWLDPEAVRAALPHLAGALCDVDPPGCDGYRDRSLAFAATIPGLVDRIRGMTAGIATEHVVTSGPFLGWWSARFGPRIAGSIEESEGVEPSASRMGAMIDAARGSIAVVGQATLPDGAARAVAEAARVPYVAVDAVGNPDSAPDYARLLLSIAEALPKS